MFLCRLYRYFLFFFILYLHLSVLPHILPFTFGDEIPNQGDTVSVSCIASKGDVPIGLTFYHNEIPVIDDNGITITKSAKIAMLSIESLRAEHRGNYTCKASNRAGQVQFSAELNINGYYIIVFNTKIFMQFIFSIFF